ncbi:hypothetical protein B6N13_09305 [Marinomonas sp. UCMA 3892]|uniref:hypothetical protein n=1 Tax=unclassified Marinomonas TaxID=196814 RepID=UPI00146BA72C|nr:hypothetical protein [Marinomonas sp. UCMA 3892]NLU98299.1 hypothetical protein [Marinomonas sp. UCMA 3892]
MTAIIGFCLPDGAFLAADSTRTDVDSGQQLSTPVRKIENLKEDVVIATGGLGTIGHNARNQLIEFVEARKPSLDVIIQKAKEIFLREFNLSFVQAPGHKIPLTCILAGRDDDGKGFICSLSSSNNFEPFWVQNVGQPYFAGTNTQLVKECATEVIIELKNSDQKLMFDKWVVESLKRINLNDKTVGFPVQLVAARETVTNIFPANEGATYLSEFVTEFPEL